MISCNNRHQFLFIMESRGTSNQLFNSGANQSSSQQSSTVQIQKARKKPNGNSKQSVGNIVLVNHGQTTSGGNLVQMPRTSKASSVQSNQQAQDAAGNFAINSFSSQGTDGALNNTTIPTSKNIVRRKSISKNNIKPPSAQGGVHPASELSKTRTFALADDKFGMSSQQTQCRSQKIDSAKAKDLETNTFCTGSHFEQSKLMSFEEGSSVKQWTKKLGIHGEPSFNHLHNPSCSVPIRNVASLQIHNPSVHTDTDHLTLVNMSQHHHALSLNAGQQIISHNQALAVHTKGTNDFNNIFSSQSDNNHHKNLKRKQTMPVGPSQAIQQAQHQMHMLGGLLQSHERSLLIESNRVNQNSSQLGIHQEGGGIGHSVGGSSTGSNAGSFLPDIYMTTTANGKVSAVSGTKQVASQGEAAKRLIKKQKQFIMIDDNNTGATSEGGGSATGTVLQQKSSKKFDDDQLSYFNMKEPISSNLSSNLVVPSTKFSVISKAPQVVSTYQVSGAVNPGDLNLDEPSSSLSIQRQTGYSQLMRQKNTPKDSLNPPSSSGIGTTLAQAKPSLTQSDHKAVQSKSQHNRPRITDQTVISSQNNLKTPQQSQIEGYYNVVITPKKSAVNGDNLVSPFQSQSNLNQPATSMKVLSVQEVPIPQSVKVTQKGSPSVTIITQAGKALGKIDTSMPIASVPGFQSPQTRTSKPGWKVSLEEAILEASSFGSPPAFNYVNGTKEALSQTTALRLPNSGVATQVGKQGTGSLDTRATKPSFSYYQAAMQTQLGEETKESQQQQASKRMTLANSAAGAGTNPSTSKEGSKTSPPTANIVVSRGLKPGQKSMKIVYKQVSDSSDKGQKSSSNCAKTFDDSGTNNEEDRPDVQQYYIPNKDQRPGVNYEQYLRPRTDRVYEFQTKRIDFRRRQSSRHSVVVILHFEGVIGEILQKNLGDDNYQLSMRHGAIEGLKELSKNFQLVIFTMLNERYTNYIIDILDKEQVAFDAVYQRLKAYKKSDEYMNYNQIYLDFEIHNPECPSPTEIDGNSDFQSSLHQHTSVQNSVMLVCPVCLENEDIKEKEGDQLLFQEKAIQSSYAGKRPLLIKGLPIDSLARNQAPLIFLVPHIKQQLGNYSVSMINICNILSSLLITSCIIKEDQIRELRQESFKDREQHVRQLREEERIKQQIQLSMQHGGSNSRSPSPKRQVGQIKTQSTIQQKGGLFMMTITTISPKNHFKKILSQTKDRVLDQRSCTVLQSFYQTKKYKMFNLKTTSSMKLVPEYQNKRKEEECLKLKQSVFKLKALLKLHESKNGPEKNTQNGGISSELIMSNQKAQQVLQELVTTNDWARQSVGQYKAEYFKNLIYLLQTNQNSSLQDLIKELEDRLVDMEAGEQFYSLLNQQANDEIPAQQSQLVLYRFLILQGHQFQNYPLETKMIIKEKDTHLKQNFISWLMKPTRIVVKQRNQQTNPLSYLNGQTSYQGTDATHHFQPGYRIFSDQYQ